MLPLRSSTTLRTLLLELNNNILRLINCLTTLISFQLVSAQDLFSTLKHCSLVYSSHFAPSNRNLADGSNI